jgi:hypothetical protein
VERRGRAKVVRMGLGRGLGYDVAASRSPGRFICVRVESTSTEPNRLVIGILTDSNNNTHVHE